jgi:hypothetical protein
MAFTPRTETYFNASSLSSPYNATVNKPSGTAEGDILFAIVCAYATGITIDSVPSGWNWLESNGSGTSDRYWLYYKIAGASEPSSYTWSLTATAKVRIVCSCYTAGDFNPSDPIDVVSNTDYRTNDSIVRAASMNVASTNSPLVFFASVCSTATKTLTKPSVPTTDWVEDDDAGSTDSDFWNEICSMIWTGSGATGTMDATCSASLTTKHAFVVALNPAGGGVPKSSQVNFPVGWTPDKALEAAISSQQSWPPGWTPGKELAAALSSQVNYPLGWTPGKEILATLASEKSWPLGWTSQSSVAIEVPKSSEHDYPLGWTPATALDAALASQKDYPLGWTPDKALDAALSSQKDYSPGWTSESSREVQGGGTPKLSEANWPLGWTSQASKANIVWKGLSDTLLAAQKSPRRHPYVEAKVYDYEAGIKRLSWTRLYDGSETDNHHGIAFDGQGSMHRIRADTGSKLYYQKVASPGPSSDYSSWTEIATDCAGPCAIAAYGAKIYIFYRTSTNVLWKYYSHNYGQDWSNAQLIATADVLSMAASWKGATDIVVCFSATLVKISAAVLDTSDQTSAEHYYNHGLDTTYGIGATYQAGEFPIVLAGKDTDGATSIVSYALYSTKLSDIYSFSSLRVLLSADEDVVTAFRYPDCHLPDGAQDYETLQLTVVEDYSGVTAYTRPLLAHLVKDTSWSDATITEPRFFIPIPSAFGLRLSTTAGYWWFSTPDGVWRAPRPAADPLDLTPYIQELHQVIGHQRPGAIVLVLDNSKGYFASPGEGSLASLRFRAEIRLRLGYKTTAGPEAVDNLTYWIDSWQYGSAANRSTFTIRCVDLWGLASQWAARYSLRWNYTSFQPSRVWQILYQFLGRLGIRLWNNPSSPKSDAIDNYYPKFLSRGGTMADTQLRRLLSFVTDGLVPVQGLCFAKDLLSTEQSCYSYSTNPSNPTNSHPILAGAYATLLTTTHTQVSGDTQDEPPVHVREAAFDWDLLSLGIDNLEMQYDANLEETDQAAKRADALLRHETLEALGDQITVPTNVGQEVYDVVTVTDKRCGIDQDKYRVLAIQTDYDRHKSQYEQRLTVGAP